MLYNGIPNVTRGECYENVYTQRYTNYPSFKMLHQRKEFSFLHILQTSSEAQPVSYPMGAGSSFPWE
jgi:hypothetical protein